MTFTTLIFRLINMQISNTSVSRKNTTWRQASRVRNVAFLVSTTDSSKSKKQKKGSYFAGSVETILLYLHLPGIKLLFKNSNEETEVLNSSLYALGCHVPIPLSSVDKPPSWKKCLSPFSEAKISCSLSWLVVVNAVLLRPHMIGVTLVKLASNNRATNATKA